MAKYVHDDLNNRIESMSKEEIYALIDEVIASGELPTDVQTAFVTALKSIVDGKPYKMGLCTQAEYNALVAGGDLEEDALYIITDDSSYNDLLALINDNSLSRLTSGEVVPKFATRLTQLEKIEAVSGARYNLEENGLYLIVAIPSIDNTSIYTAILYNEPRTENKSIFAAIQGYNGSHVCLYYTYYAKELNLNIDGSSDLSAVFKVYRLA